MAEHLAYMRARYKVIFRSTALFMMGFALLVLAVGLTSLIFEDINSFLSFLYTSLFIFTLSFVLFSFGRGVSVSEIGMQDAIVIIFFVWTLAILFSALPFIFSNILSFSHAVFEATSGWTTTGLTLVDVTKIPKVFLIWRSVMQYLGGAGFALIMVIAAGVLGAGFYQAEGRTDNIVPNLRDSARIIMTLYLMWALVGIALLKLAGFSFFDAFNHTLTALATGGFSTKLNSIGEFNNKIAEWIIIALMLIGGTGFGVQYAFLTNFKVFKKNPEPKTMFTILLIFTPAIILFTTRIIYKGYDIFRHAIFQSVSALTGTGFSTVSFDNWNHFGLLMLTILMILGGMMDSTSGGLKLFRVYVIWKITFLQIKNYFFPMGAVFRFETYKGVSRKIIDTNMLREVMAVVSMYFITYTVGVSIMTIYGYPLHLSMFEYASALSAVGLSVGITTPQTPLVVIWAETMGMYLGRLEFFVIYFAVIKLIRDITDMIKIKKWSQGGINQ